MVDGLKYNTEIDAVISWVDGKDPLHKEKMNSCLGIKKRDNIPGAHKKRFGSVNEIKYCVLSIFKFAPFIRNIYIITDNQSPHLENDITAFFPDRLDSVRIVDHKEIFEGYEHVLPVFNARAIEACMWRIKGLANNFVFFNDDFCLINPVKPTDWFRDGHPVLRGKWRSSPSIVMFRKKTITTLKKVFLNKKEPNLTPTHKVSQWKSANEVGFADKYFRTEHTPHPINKNTLQAYFEKDNKVFLKNIEHKFRHYSQFNIVALANHLEVASGDIQFEETDDVYLNPAKKSRNYIEKRLLLAETKPNVKFMCVQSLDLATKNDVDKILNWLNKRILT